MEAVCNCKQIERGLFWVGNKWVNYHQMIWRKLNRQWYSIIILKTKQLDITPVKTMLEAKKKWSLLGDTDTELLTDEGGVLSLVVVLRPAITTILFHPSLNSSSSQVTIDRDLQHHCCCHHHHHHHHFRYSNNLKFFLALSLGLLGLAGRPLLGPVGQLRRTCARPSLVC